MVRSFRSHTGELTEENGDEAAAVGSVADAAEELLPLEDPEAC
jgi:hypothetical protein